MPCAPGMLRTITVGLPGRWLARSGAIRRPDVSVPPPEGLATIMVIALSLNETSSAAAGAIASPSTDSAIQTLVIEGFPIWQLRNSNVGVEPAQYSGRAVRSQQPPSMRRRQNI